ncbi:MAG: glucose-6-phosphate dehydrogenase assembly protein OpcA [Actinobacteria bacterium]|nr:glucose-6-phosphate dehydrogenase assembly protein OpcA [Actinomycetota bacterium]
MLRNPQAEEWTGENVSIAAIERQLASLRQSTSEETEGPDLRTSVMTHMAWAPEDWLEQATETLSGLAERHPSRTLILVPDPDGDDRLDAELSVRCFPVSGQHQNVCSEVIQLRLGGQRARAPASIVQPLLIADLPVFLRWRGEPPFGAPQFEQLCDVADRLVVDSSEWESLPDAYGRLAERFDHVAVSDIAWSRTLEWRRSIAKLWPGIAQVRAVSVQGPQADALLLAGWLRSRLGRAVELRHDAREKIARIELDGEPVAAAGEQPRTPSDLLSDELDIFERDPRYEEAARAAG